MLSKGSVDYCSHTLFNEVKVKATEDVTDYVQTDFVIIL